MARVKWDNLNKEERRVYMNLQTANAGGLLVEVDIGEMYYDCDNRYCNRPVRGGGLCTECWALWRKLDIKLRGKLPSASKPLSEKGEVNMGTLGDTAALIYEDYQKSKRAARVRLAEAEANYNKVMEEAWNTFKMTEILIEKTYHAAMAKLLAEKGKLKTTSPQGEKPVKAAPENPGKGNCIAP